MRLRQKNLVNTEEWQKMDITLPTYQVRKAAASGRVHPTWVHFGAGNIFRGFVASLQQRLLDKGLVKGGIIAVETFDYEIMERIYRPNNNLVLNVALNADGTNTKEVLGSIAEGLVGEDMKRLSVIFSASSLQMVSFTITEKGYALRDSGGQWLPHVAEDMTAAGFEHPTHVISIVTSLLYKRFLKNGKPIALVSMDNCAKNGRILQTAVLDVAKEWRKIGLVSAEFLQYLRDKDKVSFPWTMIDKITPRPSLEVKKGLDKIKLHGMKPITTAKGTYIAPFVNAERPQYLVVEDVFPNGRPPLEEAGVLFCTRNVVQKAETMKVTTCLNPLHTAMSVYGCLLGYTSIAEMMKHQRISDLVHCLGYLEGLPVVVDPKIIDPKAFLDEVVEQRLPNPYMPDSPQRIATDTSQKVAIRFGETLKKYEKRGEGLKELVAIPLAIAGWFRYLLAVDDKLKPMTCSSDPMLESLQNTLHGVEVGKPETYRGQLRVLLTNDQIFGVNLQAVGLSSLIEEMFVSQLQGEGAVEKTLNKYLAGKRKG